MSPYVAALTQLCLKFMTFDPNYNYDEDEAEEDSMDIEDGIEEGLSLSLWAWFCGVRFVFSRNTYLQNVALWLQETDLLQFKQNINVGS